MNEYFNVFLILYVFLWMNLASFVLLSKAKPANLFACQITEIYKFGLEQKEATVSFTDLDFR